MERKIEMENEINFEQNKEQKKQSMMDLLTELEHTLHIYCQTIDGLASAAQQGEVGIDVKLFIQSEFSYILPTIMFLCLLILSVALIITE